MGSQAEEITPDAAIAGSAALAAENQDKRAHGSDKDTEHLFIGNGFFQVDGRYDHSDDGQSGSHNRSIYRRSQRQAENKHSLIEYQSEERSKEYL